MSPSSAARSQALRGGALGKVLFAGAVERDGTGFGRVRFALIPDARRKELGHIPGGQCRTGLRR